MQDQAPLAVLVVDDESIARQMLTRILTRDGWQVTAVAGGAQALAALKSGTFDVVLTDLVMDEVDGLQVLEASRQLSPTTQVVVMTGHASVDTAIAAMKGGPFHYVQKPVRPDEVRLLMRQAADKRRLSSRVEHLETQLCKGAIARIIGKTEPIEAVRKLVARIRQSDSNVLITGESGTGKELVARAIHECSRRVGQAFVAFNCGAFTDELVANELFGHEKDAFTGATTARKGLLEVSDGGTVFFDEVGDMSLAMQSKLLRAVQEREIIRVGGTRPVAIDLRIIAATNKDLKKLISVGAFREDLFFRLNVIPIRMPSLAERRDDIPLLAEHFLAQARSRMGKHLTGFSADALEVLAGYRYPGNVRELENIVERAASMAAGERIETDDLPPDMTQLELRTFRYEGEDMRSLDELEAQYIRWVLDRVGNNKSRAAQILGIDRVSLYRKLRRREIAG